MNIKKLSSVIVAILIFTLAVVGCGSTQKEQKASSSTPEKKNITLGISPTFKDMANVIKEDFEKDGYTLTIKLFDDNVVPNLALQEGSVDINFFQHEPYLNQFNQNKGTTLVKYHEGLIKYYMGVYSKKITNIKDLKDGAKVSIPNDPANRGRALKMLETNGLIKLKDGVAVPTKLDIVENKKKLDLVEMDVLKLSTSLDDVDASTINSILAVQGNVDPKSAIAFEDDNESKKYSIIIAVKKDQNNEKYAELFEKAVKTDRFKKYLEEKYKGAIIPLF